MVQRPFLLLITMFLSLPVFAQIDFSGEWAQIDHEDELERGEGPLLGDYTGMPINAAARLRAETNDVADGGLPEFQCRPHPAPYQWRAAGGVQILKEINPVTRELTAYHVRWVRSLDRPIYLDDDPVYLNDRAIPGSFPLHHQHAVQKTTR